jgi:CheY-like chemotaxis protein
MSDVPQTKWPRRVLVVEDHDDLREALIELLRIEGFDVWGSADGPQALRDVQTFQPEVVLLDIGLPGMDGHEVARALRSNPATNAILIIAVTGYDSASERQRATEAGVDVLLSKPMSFERLQTALHLPHGTLPLQQS